MPSGKEMDRVYSTAPETHAGQPDTAKIFQHR